MDRTKQTLLLMEQLLTEIRMEVGVLALVDHLQILQYCNGLKKSFATTQDQAVAARVYLMFPGHLTWVSLKKDFKH